MAKLIGINWEDFEYDVLQCLSSAAQNFLQSPNSQDKRVYQVSVWTDVDQAVSSVCFETLSNAMLMKQQMIEFFEKNKEKRAADKARRLMYNPDPADFEFANLCSISHKCIEDLVSNEISEEEYEKIETQVEKRLLDLVGSDSFRRIIVNLPLEDKVWIGVSSPRDWFDHVKEVDLSRK